MTKLEFWRTLKTLAAKKWEGREWIRTRNGGRAICPVCAVANAIVGEERHYNAHFTAAREIGLDREFAESVSKAADLSPDYLNRVGKGIKKQLLKVLGL